MHATLRVKSKQWTQRLRSDPVVRESSLLLANQSYWLVSHHEGMTEPLIRATSRAQQRGGEKTERQMMGQMWPDVMEISLVINAAQQLYEAFKVIVNIPFLYCKQTT